MKYALISPSEPRETGYRVAEVVDTAFEVADPLFWVNCVDSIVCDQYWYDPADSMIKPIPIPEPAPAGPQPAVIGAETL